MDGEQLQGYRRSCRCRCVAVCPHRVLRKRMQRTCLHNSSNQEDQNPKNTAVSQLSAQPEGYGASQQASHHRPAAICYACRHSVLGTISFASLIPDMCRLCSQLRSSVNLQWRPREPVKRYKAGRFAKATMCLKVFLPKSKVHIKHLAFPEKKRYYYWWQRYDNIKVADDVLPRSLFQKIIITA